MDELKKLWALAIPIIIAQVGTFAMGLVDTLLVGPMGREALSALGLGNTLFFAVLIFGIGMMMSLDAWVSQAFGAGQLADCSRGLAQGLWLALIVSPLLIAVMTAMPHVLLALNYPENMVDLAMQYMGPLRWGVYPMLCFATYRSFMTALGVTRPLLFAVALANVANFGLDLWFIHGGLGIEAQGVTGVAWSTVLCRTFFLLPPLVLVVRFRADFQRFPRPNWRPDPKLLKQLALLGTPIGFQYMAEVGCFSLAGVLMGAMGTLPLAAHGVALNLAALFFMVALGLGAAGAVRVGQNLGAGNREGVVRAGWTALGSALAYGTISAVVITIFRGQLVSMYRVEPEIFNLAVQFMVIAAVFQLADSTQATGVGVLRGLADTRRPLGIILFGYGVIAIPIGVLGAFVLDDDPRWIWVGLAVGLTVVAILLTLRFKKQVARVRSGELRGVVDPMGTSSSTISAFEQNP
ncbi:MAG TPA: hypothetical protein DIU15_12830 [Deltaproteobacteria bacterium]|nr:hypothetical protein [Deltaproteobacteria bacterium]HCP46923.1 hypothetical protein [Deltaproteobacteria bacterium]|tara:strand:+ start:91 stop:1482 length:1392 start_codon:yes stop_codon:yes gene_type:complete